MQSAGSPPPTGRTQALRAFLAVTVGCLALLLGTWWCWGGDARRLLAATPSGVDATLEKTFKDKARQLADVKKVVAGLEKELNGILSAQAQKAIQQEATREGEISGINPFLQNQAARDALKAFLVAARNKEKEQNFEYKVVGAVQQIRETIDLSDAEFEALRPVYRQILIDYGEWDKIAGRVPPAEAVIQCRQLAERLEREVAGVLPRSKADRWVKEIGAGWILRNLEIYQNRANYEADHTRPDDPFYPR